MRVANRWIVAIGLLTLLAARPAAAQTSRVVNAKLETHSAAGGLAREFESFVTRHEEPAWVGYAVPMVAGQHQICCDDSYRGHATGICGRCRLEESANIGINMQSRGEKAIQLEGSRQLLVLFRIAQKRVGRIRAFSADCELDAGGLPFLWLTDVRPAESVALLTPFVRSAAGEEEDGDGEGSNHALAAIAFTDDPVSEKALEGFVSPSQPERLRGKTTFWLGAARGKPGLALLERMAKEDSSDRAREKVAFAFYVSPEPEAAQDLILVAKNDVNGHVRGQALFWLAQKAGKKAAAAISDAIENDPDTQVKKHAVFALSQLPKDEGVPLLIKVARTNSNPAVRKQAMFWLGQANDPRALAFFEEVLSH
jgi:hypothetical protein